DPASGRTDDVGHFDHLDVAFAGTLDAIRTRIQVGIRPVHEDGVLGAADVADGLAVSRRGDDVRHGAGTVTGVDARARVTRGTFRNAEDTAGPHVVGGQVQVEVEDFAAVTAFQEADLDSLGDVGGVDHR